MEEQRYTINKDLANKYIDAGFFACEVGNSEYAKKYFNKALLIYPKRFFSHGLLKETGIAKDFGAIEDYRNVTEIDSIEASILYNDLGIVCVEYGKLTQAITCFTKSIKLTPANAIVTNATVYYNRGNTKYELKDYESAIRDYNKAIKLNSNFKAAYFHRGKTSMILEDYTSAIEDFNEIIEIDGFYDLSDEYIDNMTVYDYCIIAYECLNDNEGAEKMKERKIDAESMPF